MDVIHTFILCKKAFRFLRVDIQGIRKTEWMSYSLPPSKQFFYVEWKWMWVFLFGVFGKNFITSRWETWKTLKSDELFWHQIQLIWSKNFPNLISFLISFCTYLQNLLCFHINRPVKKAWINLKMPQKLERKIFSDPYRWSRETFLIHG